VHRTTLIGLCLSRVINGLLPLTSYLLLPLTSYLLPLTSYEWLVGELVRIDAAALHVEQLDGGDGPQAIQ
jgi:hypothetical protein